MKPFIPIITGTIMIPTILGGHYTWDQRTSIIGIEQPHTTILVGILV